MSNPGLPQGFFISRVDTMIDLVRGGWIHAYVSRKSTYTTVRREPSNDKENLKWVKSERCPLFSHRRRARRCNPDFPSPLPDMSRIVQFVMSPNA